MICESLGYDTRIIWNGEELVFDSKSEESVKRVEKYTGMHFAKLYEDCVLFTDDYCINGFYLRYCGTDSSPVQPIGLKDYYGLFYNWDGERLDLSHWDVSEVYSVHQMFYNCRRLWKVNISNWDVGNVESFDNMFAHCESLKRLDLSQWNVSKARYMPYMFSACYGLMDLNLDNWDVSRVTDMTGMFQACTKLKDLNILQWDISHKKKVYAMFKANYDLNGPMFTEWRNKAKECWDHKNTKFENLF